MSTRTATHAGSWYTRDGRRLSQELDDWIAAVVDSEVSEKGTPVPGARVIIAPHAGYSYSGPAAAWAYKSLDFTNAKRIFILGPSHHVYLTTCALSSCDTYETPLGPLTLDKSTISDLTQTKKFSRMNLSVDEEEHSIEMHLPYVYKAIQRARPGETIPIVPILVGSINRRQEKEYGEVLRPYLEDPENLFVVSSDFCHWGSRFQYQAYRPSPSSPIQHLRGNVSAQSTHDPIHKSIEGLDREGMDAIETGEHDIFADYLQRTKNTICGRHPIGVVMAGLEGLVQKGEGKGVFRFVRYEQSSAVVRAGDSSVSYASAWART